MHPVTAQLRDLRDATGLSLVALERKHGIPAIVLGSWERGDRQPTINKIQQVLDVYGYQLVAVPRARTLNGRPTVRTPAANAALLRAIADQLDEPPMTDPVPLITVTEPGGVG
jgi:transcriptional regulator with XRE-family HTH domain